MANLPFTPRANWLYQAAGCEGSHTGGSRWWRAFPEARFGQSLE